MRYALVTGASSGLGKSLAELMAQSGYHVFALSRSIEPFGGEHITTIRCDITDEDSLTQAMAIIRQTTSELDVLANCAGFGISGPIETTPLALAKSQFEVNFFGTFNITKAALDFLRPRKGRIFTISSVAATIPIPFQSFYSATKSALTSWSLCLDNELRPFGIRAIVVEPGDGYGEFESDLFETLPRSIFPPDLELEEGMGFRMHTESGEVAIVYVDTIEDDAVVVNLNHPLAGERLFFHVKIVGVRAATPEELAGDCGGGCSCGTGCGSGCC